MFPAVYSRIHKFIKDEKGGILILAALCIVPLTLMLGLAIDGSMGLQQKRKLQSAVDAAAKAGAANGNGQTATITSEAQKIFAANTLNMTGITGPNISVNTSNSTITVSASINVPAFFMKVGGINTTTYSATATVPMNNANLEVAIVYEVTARFQANSFHQNICKALIDFVNSLPNNVMVSITPIATEFLLDSSNTIPDNLFNHLSMTTNDESANPAFYSLSPNYAWTSANYATPSNTYYTSNSFANIISYASPSTCPGGYASCSLYLWPLQCPATRNTSCSQVYSYIAKTAYPILPLTLNKTLIVSYLNNLKNFSSSTDGLLPSLLSWGWRTIDPAWNDFWLVNSSSTDTARSSGKYPQAYSKASKSMIIIFNGKQYWDEYTNNLQSYYSNKCGNSQTVLGGVNHWWMTAYGMVPVPTDLQGNVVDITCENRWYKTMDKSLGLTLSDNTMYKATVSLNSFQASILNEVGAKFFRICNNIKAQGVDIYLLSNTNTSSYSSCCNTSSNAFTIANSNSSIASALNSVKTSILAN